jgi:ATP-binding cassette subfamily A (ABC1) protein 3
LLPQIVIVLLIMIRQLVNVEYKEDRHYLYDGRALLVRSRINDMTEKMIQRGHILALSPDTPAIRSLGSQLSADFPGIESTLRYFSSNSAFEDYIGSGGYSTSADAPHCEAGIIFSQFGPASYDYAIRMNNTNSGGAFPSQVPNTKRVPDVEDLLLLYKTDWIKYVERGFTALQFYVDSYITATVTSTSLDELLGDELVFAPFPVPEHNEDAFSSSFGEVLVLLFTLAYVPLVTKIVKQLVEEKELKLKETMRIMGVNNAALAGAWFTTYMIIFAITALLITIMTSGNVFKFSDKGIIFFFFWFFGISVFAFCYLMQTIFNTTSSAGTRAALIWLGLYMMSNAVSDESSSSVHALACLGTNVCFGFGARTIFAFENAQLGIQSDLMSRQHKNVSMNLVFFMFIFDTILYFLLAIYCDQVLARDWGVAKHPCFCCMRRYWSCAKGASNTEQLSNAAVGGDATANDPTLFEPVAAVLKGQELVSLQNIRKEFAAATSCTQRSVCASKNDDDAQPFVAVNNLSLNLYESQILSLLGHNGAGKTTLINMLTGMMSVTDGDAFVLGNSVRTDMSSVRDSMGVCPQHNVLWDNLTVYEHLELFAKLKGKEGDLEQHCHDMIAQLGLTEKTNVLSSQLSGGMKRKLSVGIALIGDSKIVFLDEPTSGCDPYSRRSIWELLRKYKEGRVIILTTHFMDEADYLGDRIAIMAKGRIKCLGSSLFLKNRYGVGYTMVMNKKTDSSPKPLQDLVNKYVPASELLTESGGEVSFRLPFDASGSFAALFDVLDDSKGMNDEYALLEYGISVTTLEEVFLRVGHDQDIEDMAKEKQRDSFDAASSRAALSHNHDDTVLIEVKPKSDDGSGVEIEMTSKQKHGSAANDDAASQAQAPSDVDFINNAKMVPTTFVSHLIALFVKRLSNARRDRRAITMQLLVPFLIILVGIGAIKLALDQSIRSVEVTTDEYNSPLQVPLSSNAYADAGFRTAAAAGSNRDGGAGTAVTVMDSGVKSAYIASLPTTPNPSSVLPSVFANLTNEATDMSLLLLSSYKQSTSRFGAFVHEEVNVDGVVANLTVTPFTKAGRQNATELDLPFKLSADHVTAGGPTSVQVTNIFFNTTARDSAPAFLNYYTNIRLRRMQAAATPAADPVNIRTTQAALPKTANELTLRNSIVGLIISIAFAFVPASIVSFIVAECECKAKHQQIISGVDVKAYWCANLLWDFVLFMFPIHSAFFVLWIFDITALIGENFFPLYLLSLLFCLAVIPFTYLLSFAAKSAKSAQNGVLGLYIFSSVFLLVASIVMSIIESTRDANDVLVNFYRFLPPFAFSDGMYSLLVRESTTVFGDPRGPWDYDVTGKAMLVLAAEAVGYSLAILVGEKILANPKLLQQFRSVWMKMMCCCKGGYLHAKLKKKNSVRSDDEMALNAELRHEGDADANPAAAAVDTSLDEDVVAEQRRIDADGATDAITVRHLRKVYATDPPKLAVRNVSLGIPEGECFGLLGINGAGKTSLMRILTSDEHATQGTAFLKGLNIRTDEEKVRKLLGYCPQFDALLGNLTAVETLTLFARIKGVDPNELDAYVMQLTRKLGLEQYAHKPCGTYSGGNKRKLSLGVALIGNPSIVFLDEPSTGMDPGARRTMWDLISSTMRGRSCILTTHSMEECQALCPRLGILVSGQFSCLGSPQHLKSRFAEGFQLEISIPRNETTQGDDDEATGVNKRVMEWVKKTWPNVVVVEEQREVLKFRLPSNPTDGGGRLKLASVFRTIEAEKASLGDFQYSVSEMSLEAIFIAFARKQLEERGTVAGIGDAQ